MIENSVIIRINKNSDESHLIIQKNNSNNTYAILLILLLLILCGILAFNIVLIINGINYKNNITCSNIVPVPDILIANGIIGIINLPLIVKYQNNPIYKMFSVLYLLLYSIVVSMIYFKDCFDLLPSTTNKLLLTSLIFNYIELLGKIMNK